MLKLATILLLVSTPLAAEPLQCSDHADLVAQLATKYDEHQVAIGTTTTGPLVEVFVSLNGTWTLVVTTADKHSCLLASGENWMMVDWPPANGREG